MGQVDFAYAVAADGAGLPLGVSVFADRAHVRDEIAEDVGSAGLALQQAGCLDDLMTGEPRHLGEVILLDCPFLEPGGLAALSRLDSRVAQSGAHLIVSTTVGALDDVFGCCSQSDPQILVSPRRADRIIALGQLLASVPNMRLRELSEEDRITLLRLTEQVNVIAEKLDRIDGSPQDRPHAEVSTFQFGDDAISDSSDRLVRSAKPPLPDPRLIRRILHQRQLRARFFDAELFADPAWDMLLDLTAARVEHNRVSVTSLCIASGVPPTTALRWISQMTEAGLLERVEDEEDKRRAFVQLSDKAADAMARFFNETGKAAAHLV